MDSGAIAYIRQHKRAGPRPCRLVRAALLSNEPFAVILPDDVIAAETPCLQQMVEAYSELGGNMVAAMEVPDEQTSAYGILDVKEDMGSVVSVKGMVEKPRRVRRPRTSR
jgi:UTP--glucose-1-phosphate uridylyltransferase